MIDELPLLAYVATQARGTTEIRGAGELVREGKRSHRDRRLESARGRRRPEELPDGLVVSGLSGPLRGRVITHGDHRIAMAFGVLGALPGNEIVIDDPACVAVSYPEFWSDLTRAKEWR